MSGTVGIKPSLTRNSLAEYVYIYLTCIGFVILAFALHSLLQPFLGTEAPFLLFYTALVTAAWRGGFRAGLLATACAVVLSLYSSSTAFEINSGYLSKLSLFMLEGTVISLLIYRMRISRQETVDALAANQERLQLALEAAKISVYTNDRDLRYTWISRVHPSFGPLDMIGKRDDDLLPHASVAELMALKQEVIRSGQRRQRYIHTTVANEEYDFFVIANPMSTSRNGVNGVTVAAVDVTNATRLQVALDTQKRFTDTILRAMPAVAYVFDIQAMQNRFVSPYAKQALGYTPEEITSAGASFFQNVIHPEDQPALQAHFADLAQSEADQPKKVEYRMRHRDGHWLWFSTDDVVFRRDETGAVCEVLGVAQEITERKQTEVALRESEEKFRVALKSASFIVAQVDRDLRYTWIHNPHHRFDPDSIIGKRDDELDPSAGSLQLMALKRRVLESGQGAHERITFALPEGDRTYAVTAEPLVDETGTLIGVTSAGLDVTDYERMLGWLKQSETLRLLAMEAAGMGTWVNSADGKSVLWDAQARRIFGITPGESVSAEKGFAIIHPEDRSLAQEAYARAMAPESSGEYAVEKRIVWPDGSVHWVSTKGRVIFDGAGGVGQPGQLVGVVTDITERKQVENRLRESLEQLRLAKQAGGLGIYDYHIPDDNIEWDAHTRSLWGVGPDEPIRYQTFMDGVHPDDREFVLAAVERSMVPDGEGNFSAEYRVIHRVSNTVRWISANGKVYFEHNRPLRLIGTVQDITREKLLYAELESVLEEYKRLADAMPQLVWTANERGDVNYYNSRAADFDGITQNEDGTWAYHPVLHPDDVEMTLAAWQHALAHNEPYECEHRVRMADGSYRWHISRAACGTTFNGIVKWYGTATDIHDLKQVQQSLRESEARFRNVADYAPMMIWVTEADGRCTFLSQSWYDFTGQTPETGLDFGWLAVVHPDDRPRVHENFMAATRKRAVFSMEFRLHHTSGTYRWAIDSARPRMTPDGQFIGYIGSVVDITERKQQEDIVRQQRAILQQLVDSLPIMITIYEPDARMLYLNHAFERLTGWDKETAASVDFMAELYPDPEYRAMVLAYMQSLEPGWRDFEVTARDGSIIASSWANIRLADGRQVGIGIDVRERLQNEKRNYTLRTVAAALSKALSPEEVTEISLSKAIAKTDAVAGTVAILSADKQQLEIVGTYGYPDYVADKWRFIPLDHPTAPVALAIREDRALWMGSPHARDQIIPRTPNLGPHEQHKAWAVLPFNVDSQLRGVFALGFATPQFFDESERTFLLTLTDTCAQALARTYLSKKLQETAALEERHRLARDLHDGVKQLLFASSAMSETLPRMLERRPERAQEIAQDIHRLNRAALAEMQILLMALRPDSIIKTSFKLLLENLCQGLQGKREQLRVELDWNGSTDCFMPEEVHMTFYRLVQEAFNNIVKHSEAVQVVVRCVWHDNGFDLEIRDDGKGFDLKRASIGLGMNSMRERAASVGALFNIESRPGAGTKVMVQWQA